MSDLNIDNSKLLGFRLINDSKKISMEVKLGAKVGAVKPAKASE
jgi:hypothetical protein